MKNMYSVILVFLFIGNSFGQEAEEKMETIFDGTNLNHWQVPDGNVWWSINGGSLWAESDTGQTGSILWTKKSYTDFVVQMDFKFGKGTIDSGIFMRGDDEKNPQI